MNCDVSDGLVPYSLTIPRSGTGWAVSSGQPGGGGDSSQSRSDQGSVAKRRARFLGARDALLGFSTRATICLRAPTSICSALMP